MGTILGPKRNTVSFFMSETFYTLLAQFRLEADTCPLWSSCADPAAYGSRSSRGIVVDPYKSRSQKFAHTHAVLLSMYLYISDTFWRHPPSQFYWELQKRSNKSSGNWRETAPRWNLLEGWGMRILFQEVLAKPGDSRCIMAHAVLEYFPIDDQNPGVRKCLILTQSTTARVRWRNMTSYWGVRCLLLEAALRACKKLTAAHWNQTEY